MASSSGASVFFDSNVLLYLLSSETIKADRAEALIAQGGTVSVQVLNEFCAVARRKFGLQWAAIREILAELQIVLRVEEVTLDVHRRGIAIAERYQYGVHDSMVLAAALIAQCTVLYSEDLHAGQKIQSLSIRNPF